MAPEDNREQVATERAVGMSLATGPSERSQGQWSGVWKQLKRNRLAMAGLYVVFFLLTLAVAADFVANDKPYYMVYHGRSYFPLFRSTLVKLGLAKWPAAILNAD